MWLAEGQLLIVDRARAMAKRRHHLLAFTAG
jgi:hypothetical protein